MGGAPAFAGESGTGVSENTSGVSENDASSVPDKDAGSVDTTSADAAAAAAAVACSSSSCSGKDPQTTRCSTGATTLTSAQDPWVLVELRFSSACQAVWTRATMRSSLNGGTPYRAALVWYSCSAASASCRKGWYVTKQDLWDKGDVAWTNMRPFTPGWFRGCNLEWFRDPPDFEWCTAAR
jgi:hypothetical protein